MVNVKKQVLGKDAFLSVFTDTVSFNFNYISVGG